MDLPDDMAHLLDPQSGLVTRSQLLAAGLTRSAVQWQLQRNWRIVLPGVIATFTGHLDPRQRLIAAQLFGGPGAVLSAGTAAAWHGVESARTHRVHLLVPGNRSSRASGIVVATRSHRPDLKAWSRPPLTFSSRGRAVMDAARAAQVQERANQIVIEAVQRRLVTLPMLRHELELGPQRGSRQPRLALQAAETGVWSLPEFDLAKLATTSTVLPETWANPTLRTTSGNSLPTPDLWLDDVGLAVQVHSRTYHQRDDDWEGTVLADTALGEQGIVVVGVTPGGLARDPAAVLARIERAYLSLHGRPRPDVVAARTSIEL